MILSLKSHMWATVLDKVALTFSSVQEILLDLSTSIFTLLSVSFVSCCVLDLCIPAVKYILLFELWGHTGMDSNPNSGFDFRCES